MVAGRITECANFSGKNFRWIEIYPVPFLSSIFFPDIFSTKTLPLPFVTSGTLSSVDSQHRCGVDHHIGSS